MAKRAKVVIERKGRATNVDKEIGRRIKIMRQEVGLSQAELGEHLGVTFQQIQKYENGTNRVAAGRLVTIAILLKTTVAELTAAPNSGATAIDATIYGIAKRIGKAPSKRIRLALISLMEAINASEAQAQE